MALKIKNDPGLGTSDGLRIPSRRAAASVVARYILTIDVQPTALRAIVDAKLRYKSFRFFPQLPVEIQLQIWEYAVGKGPAAIIVPREFASWGNRERGHEAALVREGKGGIQKWSGAALLSTCRLSREVARRVWGSNVRNIPSPGVYTTSGSPSDLQHRDGFMGDLATDLFYWRHSWSSAASWIDDSDSRKKVRISNIAVRYDLLENNECDEEGCDVCPSNMSADNPCDMSIGDLVWGLVGLTKQGVPTAIRRFAMVVEDFGVISTGKARAAGPVYTTLGGVEFYDVTDGLVDVRGRELFEAAEGKLRELEDAKRMLTRLGMRWQEVLEEWGDPPNTKLSFRILVGVRK